MHTALSHKAPQKPVLDSFVDGSSELRLLCAITQAAR